LVLIVKAVRLGLCSLIAAVFLCILAPGDCETRPAGSPPRIIRLAVTVDDLPAHAVLAPGWTRVAVASAVLRALHDNGISEAYGFANGYMEKYEPGVDQVLRQWLEAGYPLGNHTYGHVDLAKVPSQTYIADIARLDRLLQTIAPGQPLVRRRHVFRYPFLSEGDTLEKRNAVRSYLFRNGYRIGEVTTDFNDWAWNDAYVRCAEQDNKDSMAWLAAHVIPDAEWHLDGSVAMAYRLFHRSVPQILVVHIGVFEAVMLDKILKDLSTHGVKYITLNEALSDPVYDINPNRGFGGGETFFKQIADARRIDVTKYIEGNYPVDMLDGLCTQGRLKKTSALQPPLTADPLQ
jgi:peptidoglycan-N-acetylglucosamine deacetylase